MIISKIKVCMTVLLLSVNFSCSRNTLLKPFLADSNLNNQAIYLNNQSMPIMTNNLKEINYSHLINLNTSETNKITTKNFKIKKLTAIKNNQEIEGTGIINSIVVKNSETSVSGIENIVLNFDGSGSMSSNDPHKARSKAGNIFVSNLKNSQKIAIYEYNTSYIDFNLLNINFQVKSADDSIIEHTCFTNDKNILRNSLQKLTENGGNPFYTSIAKIISTEEAYLKDNGIIITFTDGDVGHDEFKTKAFDLATSYKIKNYIIGLEAENSEIDFQPAINFANATGGTFTKIKNIGELGKIFENLSNLINEGSEINYTAFFPEYVNENDYKIIAEIEFENNGKNQIFKFD